MLKAMGLGSVNELFAPIPAEYRLNRDPLRIPRQMAESEIVDYFRQRSSENGEHYLSFSSAGALRALSSGHYDAAHLTW